MSPDLDEFRVFADCSNISEDQKMNLSTASGPSTIMQNAVDRAFDADPVQQVLASRNARNAKPRPLVLDSKRVAGKQVLEPQKLPYHS